MEGGSTIAGGETVVRNSPQVVNDNRSGISKDEPSNDAGSNQLGGAFATPQSAEVSRLLAIHDVCAPRARMRNETP